MKYYAQSYIYKFSSIGALYQNGTTIDVALLVYLN